MTDSPSSEPLPDAEAARLVADAATSVTAFLTHTENPEELASKADEALHRADDLGVDRDRLADGLEVPPATLDVILDGDVDLIDLHPTRTTAPVDDDPLQD